MHGQDASQFDRMGFLYVPNLLSKDEAAHYRALLQKSSDIDDTDFDKRKARFGGWSQADGVTRNREYWPLIFNPRLLSHIRSVVGPDARYTQHSDLHVHHGTVGWHRDNVDRQFAKGADWDEDLGDYRVVRVALYLQNYEESQFQMGVIPGSHREESFATWMEMKMWNQVGKLSKKPFLQPLSSVKPVWIRLQAGDCLIFDQRLYHSGSRLQGPKYSIYLSYGAPNEHSRNHIRYYRHVRKELKYDKPAPDLEAMLKQGGLFIDEQP